MVRHGGLPWGTPVGSSWIQLDPAGSSWIQLGPGGSTWIQLDQAGSSWVEVDQCASVDVNGRQWRKEHDMKGLHKKPSNLIKECSGQAPNPPQGAFRIEAAPGWLWKPSGWSQDVLLGSFGLQARAFGTLWVHVYNWVGIHIGLPMDRGSPPRNPSLEMIVFKMRAAGPGPGPAARILKMCIS